MFFSDDDDSQLISGPGESTGNSGGDSAVSAQSKLVYGDIYESTVYYINTTQQEPAVPLKEVLEDDCLKWAMWRVFISRAKFVEQILHLCTQIFVETLSFLLWLNHA